MNPFTRWGLTGMRAEPVDLASAYPAEEVEARLRAHTLLGPAALSAFTRRGGGRYPRPHGGYRLAVPTYQHVTHRFAYVRIVPDGAGSRIVGELRPSRTAFAVWATGQVVALGYLFATVAAWSPRALEGLIAVLVTQVLPRLDVYDGDRLLRLLADIVS